MIQKISQLKARQILDSRGNPTIEVDVTTDGGITARASVPSGASTGKKEALELRDHRADYFLGKSVQTAVSHVNNEINDLLKGKNITDQKGIDYAMIEADGSENKSKFGANAILGVSLACARAAAQSVDLPLFQYLNCLFDGKEMSREATTEFVLPTPLMNIINGGSHASNNLDIQEFMITPHLNTTFEENLRAGVEVFHHLKKVLSGKSLSTNVGDEGGFAPSLKNHQEAIEVILEAIEKAGYRPGDEISLSFDAAANEFFRDGHYFFEGEKRSSEQMIDYYQSLVKNYPVYSIEDALDEDDHQGWQQLTERLGAKTVLVGDDLFVTNQKIFSQGIADKKANAILIKVNQIGSLTETFETLKMAQENNYKMIISHRSGETADSFIADLAVAVASGHIKTGSASRSDRMEKYNQLLRIAEHLGHRGKYQPVR